jgi:hypothetical protein
MGRGVELILRVTLLGKACDLEVLISKVILLNIVVFFSNVVKRFLIFFLMLEV